MNRIESCLTCLNGIKNCFNSLLIEGCSLEKITELDQKIHTISLNRFLDLKFFWEKFKLDLKPKPMLEAINQYWQLIEIELFIQDFSLIEFEAIQNAEVEFVLATLAKDLSEGSYGDAFKQAFLSSDPAVISPSAFWKVFSIQIFKLFDQLSVCIKQDFMPFIEMFRVKFLSIEELEHVFRLGLENTSFSPEEEMWDQILMQFVKLLSSLKDEAFLYALFVVKLLTAFSEIDKILLYIEGVRIPEIDVITTLKALSFLADLFEKIDLEKSSKCRRAFSELIIRRLNIFEYSGTDASEYFFFKDVIGVLGTQRGITPEVGKVFLKRIYLIPNLLCQSELLSNVAVVFQGIDAEVVNEAVLSFRSISEDILNEIQECGDEDLRQSRLNSFFYNKLSIERNCIDPIPLNERLTELTKEAKQHGCLELALKASKFSDDPESFLMLLESVILPVRPVFLQQVLNEIQDVKLSDFILEQICREKGLGTLDAHLIVVRVLLEEDFSEIVFRKIAKKILNEIFLEPEEISKNCAACLVRLFDLYVSCNQRLLNNPEQEFRTEILFALLLKKVDLNSALFRMKRLIQMIDLYKDSIHSIYLLEMCIELTYLSTEQDLVISKKAEELLREEALNWVIELRQDGDLQGSYQSLALKAAKFTHNRFFFLTLLEDVIEKTDERESLANFILSIDDVKIQDAIIDNLLKFDFSNEFLGNSYGSIALLKNQQSRDKARSEFLSILLVLCKDVVIIKNIDCIFRVVKSIRDRKHKKRCYFQIKRKVSQLVSEELDRIEKIPLKTNKKIGEQERARALADLEVLIHQIKLFKLRSALFFSFEFRILRCKLLLVKDKATRISIFLDMILTFPFSKKKTKVLMGQFLNSIDFIESPIHRTMLLRRFIEEIIKSRRGFLFANFLVLAAEKIEDLVIREEMEEKIKEAVETKEVFENPTISLDEALLIIQNWWGKILENRGVEL